MIPSERTSVQGGLPEMNGRQLIGSGSDSPIERAGAIALAHVDHHAPGAGERIAAIVNPSVLGVPRAVMWSKPATSVPVRGPSARPHELRGGALVVGWGRSGTSVSSMRSRHNDRCPGERSAAHDCR